MTESRENRLTLEQWGLVWDGFFPSSIRKRLGGLTHAECCELENRVFMPRRRLNFVNSAFAIGSTKSF